MFTTGIGKISPSGAGPQHGVSYIYVADIGDNLARHEFKFIYRFEEPVLGGAKEMIITHFDNRHFEVARWKARCRNDID